MKLIAGLGNPGQRYEGSRHNLGFRVVDRIAERLAMQGWRSERDALTLRGTAADGAYLLVKPQTYMNLSGVAVGGLAHYYRVPVECCVAVVDDLDLAPGKVRTRISGSDGGHNGLRSLIEHLGGREFKRIRIGIGRPPSKAGVTGWVLGGSKEDEAALTDAVEQSVDIAIRYLETGEFENWSSA